MSTLDRRNQGLLFKPDDEDWTQMKAARRLTYELNTGDPTDFEGKRAIVNKLFGKSDETTFVNPPFHCDYGSNIFVGRNFFANYNCVILDNARVTIGDNCFIAPNVSIYTAGHPLHPEVRNTFFEYGMSVTIGDNVWIGGNVVICPGVCIGNNVVIGAGSVVTKDIPDWSLAAGNPCKVVRQITKEDKKCYYRDKLIDPETELLIKEASNI